MDTDTAVIRFAADDGSGIEFEWHGGAYIDVGYTDADGEFVANDVINVWDDEAENSYLEHEPEGGWLSWKRPFRIVLERFEERCRQYVAENIDGAYDAV